MPTVAVAFRQVFCFVWWGATRTHGYFWYVLHTVPYHTVPTLETYGDSGGHPQSDAMLTSLVMIRWGRNQRDWKDDVWMLLSLDAIRGSN